MSYILFIVYLLLCSWLLCKIKFIVNAGISKKIIVILFITKVFAGIFIGWLSRAYTTADTWLYHADGLKEYYLFFTHPKEYLTNLFVSNYNDTYGGFFRSTNSYWNDLKLNLIVKLISIFDIFSFGNYYINVIFFNFLIFFGNVALFKVFSAVYKNRSLLLVFLSFLLPSFLFFSSTIQKEGLVISALGIILYVIYRYLSEKVIGLKRLIFLLCSFLLIFLFRNYVLIALLPALTALIISKRSTYRPIYIYMTVYFIGILLFFSIGKIIPSLDLPQIVVNKQESFFELEDAKTLIPTHTLQPHFKSFILNAPEALNHTFLRPYISDGHSSGFMYPMAMEIILYELLFILFIFFNKKGHIQKDNAFIMFGLFFAASLFLIIGYITPVLGAIVRYRSIYLPFIITPIMLSIDYKKIASVLSIKK